MVNRRIGDRSQQPDFIILIFEYNGAANRLSRLISKIDALVDKFSLLWLSLRHLYRRIVNHPNVMQFLDKSM